jgi:hypothetical protein
MDPNPNLIKPESLGRIYWTMVSVDIPLTRRDAGNRLPRLPGGFGCQIAQTVCFITRELICLAIVSVTGQYGDGRLGIVGTKGGRYLAVAGATKKSTTCQLTGAEAV